MTAPRDILAGLWRSLDLPAAALDRVALAGSEPVLPSSFRVDAAAQATIAAVAAAAALAWRRRDGAAQDIAVGLRAAAAEFLSERLVRVDGAAPRDLWDRIAGAYRCGDGRWVRLHTNFAHHRDGVLRLLGCANDRDAVAKALASRQAEAFETAATEAGMVVAMMRRFAEWDAHAHAAAIAAAPLVAVRRIGPAPPETLPPAARPLGGLRVLDLTRIIAGPVCGRALAAHGADVLRAIGPDVPTIAALDIDSGRGKLSAMVDLGSDAGREAMRGLMRAADVVVQSYRPGALQARGFGPDAVAALRPGIVYASLSAYGADGPWGGKRGFDSLVQTAMGFNHAEGEAAGVDGPKPLPCQALDHASGYLLALGVLASLDRRAAEGGSWRVDVSLARTAHWLRGLGRLERGLEAPAPQAGDPADALEVGPSTYGLLGAVPHAARLSATPARWERPSAPFGTHPPAWPARAGAWAC